MVNRADVMTVREMINAAVVMEDCNPVVDFKMIESVLYIIGRHMNILQRHVMVSVKNRLKVKKRLSVTEVKIHTMTMKKRKAGKKKTSRKTRIEEPSDTSEDPHKKNKSQFKRGKHSIDPDASDTSLDKSRKKKYRSRPRSKSRSKDHKDFIRSDPDTSDDQTKRKKKSRSRSRSRSKSLSEKRKHFRGTSSKTFLSSAEKKSKEAAKPKSGSRKTGRREKDGEDDAMEVLREKLLVVSRSTTESVSDHHGSVVTQEQFDRLTTEINQLQAKFGIKDMFANSDSPRSSLHKATSLTDPRAALNMAARLDAAEKKTTDMLTVFTEFAKQIPGINIEKASDARFLQQTKLEPESQQTQKPGFGIQVNVEEYLGTGETEPEEDNLVTKEELNDGLKRIQVDLLQIVPAEASHFTATAIKASQIFQQIEPKLMEAQLIKSKYFKVHVLADAFANKVTSTDKTLNLQMGDVQENLSQMQYDLEMTLERIDDISAHPKEDPNAVAAIKEAFTSLQLHIDQTNSRQTELAELHTYGAADLKMLWKKIEILQKKKTTREDVLKALENKVSLNDLNGLLAKEQFYAVIGFLQQHILTLKEQISSGELLWQKLIEELTLNLYDRATHIQLDTLSHSIYMCMRKINEKLDKMLHIVGEYPVNMFKKKLDRDGNCLCCGASLKTNLSDEYIEIAKRLMTLPVVKSPKIDESEIKQPCIPGLPIPHPLDPRALICKRYCGGASIAETEVRSQPSSFAIGILDINPVNVSDTKSQVYVEDLKKRCTPCTHSKEALDK